jgi:hypothetical protein
MARREQGAMAVFYLAGLLGPAFSQPAAVDTEAAALRGGVPEAMPGFHVKADGSLLVSDPIQKQIKTCFESKMKRRVVWTAVPTARLLSLVSGNGLDFAYPMQFKSERTATMQPSEYTWRIDMLQITRKKIDLSNKSIRVGVRLNSPEYADMKDAGYSSIDATSDYEALSKMLTADLIDVAVLPDTVYREMGGSWSKGLTLTVRNSREVGFYLNKGDPGKLLDLVNRAVKACRPH